MFGNTIARSVPFFHFCKVIDFFSQSLMHDLCVPSIYCTHDFVSNVNRHSGKKVLVTHVNFGKGYFTFAQVIFTVIYACCLNHPI